MKKVRVSLGNGYEVKIGRGILAAVGEELLAIQGKPCKVMVISDDRVFALYGETVCAALSGSGFQVCSQVFLHGEVHKDLSTWQELVQGLAENRLTRTDYVLALGGGVTGDMAGFAAAAYLRGIPFVQVPTTLLAMVDSSVGGKTGVNLSMGKNLVGAFYQPSLVLCDPEVLSTLPSEILLDGVAETVKTAVLFDSEMFDWFVSGEYVTHMEEMITRCVQYKAAVVAADERDVGNRQLLNLGHTFGHALEKLSGYEWSHGYAVAVGMVYAARLSRALGLCGEDVPSLLVRALEACGLPVSAPYSPADMLAAALSDKKRDGDILRLVLPKTIGDCILYPATVSALPELFELAVKG